MTKTPKTETSKTYKCNEQIIHKTDTIWPQATEWMLNPPDPPPGLV